MQLSPSTGSKGISEQVLRNVNFITLVADGAFRPLFSVAYRDVGKGREHDCMSPMDGVNAEK
jgi:hypothetical protein